MSKPKNVGLVSIFVGIGTMLIGTALKVLLDNTQSAMWVLGLGAVLVARGFWMARAVPGVASESPRVIIGFSKEKLPFDARNRWVGERPIYIENIGKSPALAVQIEQVKTEFAIAEFPELPILKPGERLPVRPEITDISNVTPGVSEFEVLLQVQCGIDGWRETAKRMRIAYRDALGEGFSTDLVAKYEPQGMCSATDFRFTPTTV